ncbi:ArdC family protein [Chromobacterium phragmitis]|uniref:ArdC family protein n=1 Tax=Chromobacterium phragmitis TaxID=2202141 RepID=UPI0032640134
MQRNYGPEAARFLLLRAGQASAAGNPYPFRHSACELPPFNPVSGTVYQGINHLLLEAALPAGSSDPRWLTLKQMMFLQQSHPSLALKPNAIAATVVFAHPAAAHAGNQAAPLGREPLFALKGCTLFAQGFRQTIDARKLASPPQRGSVLLIAQRLMKSPWRARPGTSSSRRSPLSARHLLQQAVQEIAAPLVTKQLSRRLVHAIDFH